MFSSGVALRSPPHAKGFRRARAPSRLCAHFALVRTGQHACDFAYSRHADLRIPLRKVRNRQRDFGSFQRLAGNALPQVRLEEIDEKTFHLRVVSQRPGRGSGVFGRAQLVRALRDRRAPFALNQTLQSKRPTSMGSECRWRADFAGPPKSLVHPVFFLKIKDCPRKMRAESDERRRRRAASACTRAACAPQPPENRIGKKFFFSGETSDGARGGRSPDLREYDWNKRNESS